MNDKEKIKKLQDENKRLKERLEAAELVLTNMPVINDALTEDERVRQQQLYDNWRKLAGIPDEEKEERKF